jgi:hypothetical protein
MARPPFGQDERLERLHAAVAEEVTGDQVRAGDQQVALAGLRPGPTRMGVSSALTTWARMIRHRIALCACATAEAARSIMEWTNPGEGSGQGLDQRRAAVH